MPLAFQSINRGEIAFGFFNIESDCLLLENLFFFADDFCHMIKKIAKEEEVSDYSTSFPGYLLERSQIGDLMGAIHGICMEGFIGELYKIFPFPKEIKDFKQNPEGFKNRNLVESLLRKYSKKRAYPFMVKKKYRDLIITFSDILFTCHQFHELIRYVWEGGYPRWKDGIRPFYVIEMKEAINKSENQLLKNLTLH